MGPRVRNAFIADEGQVLVSMDFSQQELRIMAHVSRDPKLRQIYFDGKDIYSETAYELWGHAEVGPLDTDAQKKASWHRGIAKILILGLGFGMGVKKFAKNAKISERDAKRLVDKYHATYPGVKAYQKRAADFGKKHGYIVTMCGRERVLPFINGEVSGLVSKDERACGNTPVQGSAADMTKKATNLAYQRFMSEGEESLKWPVQFWLWVHDEIIYQIDKTWAAAHPEAIARIRQSQERALPLIVPMVSSVQFEDRWGTEVRPDALDDDLLEALEDAA
jgi:DNA polymerase-1